MSSEFNKGVIRRYFGALDGGKVEVIRELFTEDCVIHRPESPSPIVGLEGIKRIVSGVLERYSHFKTMIYDIIAETDRVVCRLSHRATYKGNWTSRIGEHSVEGKQVNWDAIAIFRMSDSKIAEEWVCRDELGMLLQLGVLEKQR
jgi:predicted ester cyclase